MINVLYAAGTPCDHFGPFSADKIPSAGEVDASSLTTYEWLVLLPASLDFFIDSLIYVIA